MAKPHVGQQLGNYRLLRLLGQGGFADVYLGEHLYLQTLAAIKILHTHLASDDSERFVNEARTIARLTHPYIVRVLDFGIEDHLPFLVMEYAPYGTLRQRYPKGSRLPLVEIMPYAVHVANALQYAHSNKLIHRDVKPENMLVNPNRDIWLSDFGMALITQSSHYQSTQEVVGTAAYMAPEQLQGKPQPASDQYALGVVIYEWLSGERPFRGSFTEIASQHLLAPPPPLYGRVPGITPDVESVVLTALNKDPQRRFKTMDAFVNALEQAHRSERSNTSVQSGESTITMSQEDELGVPTQVINPATKQPTHQPQVSDSSPIEPQTSKGDVSRRRVLLGLAGALGVIAVGGGIAGVALSSKFSFNNSTVVPPAHPTPLPAGVLNIYHKHTLDVYAAEWSPDGKRVVSGSADRTVQVWDAMTGDNSLIYRGHTDEINSVSWWSEVRLIASGSKDNTVRVWDSGNGNTETIYKGHTQPLRTVVWAPSGSLIASGGDDKTVQVWDGITQASVSTYTGHTDVVWAVDWSPDGKRVVSASQDKTVQVWDAKTGNNILIYKGHTAGALGVAWSHDGKYIASCGRDATVQVWDATTGNNVFIYRGHPMNVWTVAWSHDGRRIASGGKDTTVQIWDSMTGDHVFIYTHHTSTVWSAYWSPAAPLIASASSDKTVQVWQAS
jgi:WD40 repeat protein